MNLSARILIIFSCGIAAALMTILAIRIGDLVRPPRNLLLFDFSGLVYILFGTIAFVAGCVLSLIVLNVRFVVLAFALSIVAGVLVSWNVIRSALEVYGRPGHFDSEQFWYDIYLIGANFVIYPVVCAWALVMRGRYSISDTL